MDTERLLVDAEELAEIGSFSLELPGLEASWSPGMRRLLGLGAEPREVTLELAARHTHPADRERMGAMLRAIVEAPGDVPEAGIAYEYRALRADGAERLHRGRGRVQRDSDGRPLRWLGVVQDVTEQRLDERELRVHYALGQALREWESFDAGVIELLRGLGTALEYPLGTMWTWDDEREALTSRALWCAPGTDAAPFEALTARIGFRPGEGVPGQVWETGRAVVVCDLEQFLDPRRRLVVAQLGLRSAVAFAALDGNGPLAVLAFYGFETREPSERLARALERAGAELGHFLLQHRDELHPGRLSAREREVLGLAAEGCNGPQIAERLVVSPATVKTHFENIYEKLGVGDRAAAVAHALRTGIIS